MTAPVSTRETLSLRDWWRAAVATAGLMVRADLGRTLASGLSFSVSIPAGVLTAIWSKELVNGVVAGRDHAVVQAAVLLGASASAVFLAVWVGIKTMIPMIENVGAYLDRQLLTMTAGTPGLVHHERADHADRMEILRLQRGGLSSMSGNYVQFVGVVLQAVATLGLLVREDVELLFLPLFAIPTLVATAYSTQRTQRAADATAEAVRRARHLFELGTSAGPAKEMRIFGIQSKLIERYRATWRSVQTVQDRAVVVTGAASALAWMVFSVGYGLAIFLIVRKAVHGQATVGDVVLVIGLAASTNQLVSAIVGLLGSFAQSLRIAHRYVWLRDLHESETRLDRSRRGAPPARLTTGLVVEDLGFSYPGSDAPVLRDVNLHIPAGSSVALVGDNGAGKTTLVKLLAAMYEPTAGRILVDGVDLAGINRTAWRARLTAAFQDFARVELVAQESVGVGRLEDIEDEARVGAALSRAQADDVVATLARGLRTQLGTAFTDGVDLSGGQWQKLALGRAMMRAEPLLLILDEPTASLDAETEHLLFQQYAAAARDAAQRTGGITVLVSHRFSTVRMADQIVVVSGGTVAESGTHEALMAAGGTYAELYALQARGYR